MSLRKKLEGFIATSLGLRKHKYHRKAHGLHKTDKVIFLRNAATPIRCSACGVESVLFGKDKIADLPYETLYGCNGSVIYNQGS